MNRTIFLYFILGTLSLTSLSGKAQECIHSKLSQHFYFKTNIARNSDTSDFIHGAKIDLLIYNKHKELLQKLSFKSEFLFDDAYNNCSNVRSYVTGFNQKKDVLDFDFGDLIVADLNFDSKEDFAIKYDSGGNGGPSYGFYIQDSKGSFKLDHFLTDSVRSFPEYINAKNKTLTTHINANGRTKNEKTYKFYAKIRRWHLIKWDDREY